MKANFDFCFEEIMKDEGGFVNDPRDPGGVTNLGVTRRAWEDWVGHGVMIAEIKALRPEDVKAFYRARYWNVINADSLPAGVDYAVFDLAVNSGCGRAAKTLQKVVGVVADGAIGPLTLAAVAKLDPAHVISELCSMRIAFMKGLPIWSIFGKGWTKRVADVASEATKMAKLA